MPLVTERRGRTLVITMNRPHAMNAATVAMAEAMEEAMDELDSDPELWAAVLTGAGGTFCSGGDLTEGMAGKVIQTERGGLFGFFSRPPDKTLIAAIEGVAVGGGLELALVCDLIVAARGARMGLPEVRHSMMALGGGLVRLPRRMPYHVAMDMILTGELRLADDLAALGLVSRLCEPGAALDTALALADRICRNGPVAVNASRRIVKASATIGDEAAVWVAQDGQMSLADVQATEDFKEGIQAFFDKRPPVWKNR